MDEKQPIPAALSLDPLASLDARSSFDLAAGAGYRGIAFGTHHRELNPDALGVSGRRHLQTILGSKRLTVEAIRAAGARGGLIEAAAIDRTLENARRAMVLARELGVQTVSLDVGRLTDTSAGRVSEGTVVSALRELAQQADAAGLTLALSADSVEALGKVLKQVDFQGARINLDGSRVIGAGEDILQAAELSAGIGQFTAADAVRRGSAMRATMLGEGQIPLPDLMEVLNDHGFRGPIVVDVRDLPDSAAAAQHAANVLRRTLRR